MTIVYSIVFVLFLIVSLLPLEIRFAKQVLWRKGGKVWLEEVRKALHE